MKNAREAAMKTLLEVDFKGAYSNLALKGAIGELSAVDRAFVTRLVYGCISMRLTLDYIISVFSDTKLTKLSDCVLELLRMGIYQIIYMDKIPDSAAVNECVKLASKYAKRSSGFVNAVLRNVSRKKDSIEFPSDETELLSIKYSFPRELCKSFTELYGYEFTRSFLESLCSEPELIIRCNLLKTSKAELAEKLGARPIEGFSCALAASGLDVGASKEYNDGLFTVQDTAAQLACEVLSPNSGDIVLDLCAAPGGKTTYLAELMKNKGRITAFDIHPHKTELIEKNAQRMGHDIIETCAYDSSVLVPPLCGSADKVLVDAPCSGLGIVRRKPEIKWNLKNTEELTILQKKLLDNAVCYLKPGGAVVYCTCTVLPEENSEIVKSVLAMHPELEAEDISQYISKETAKDGYVTLFPHTDGTDGFFICKLRKKK